MKNRVAKGFNFLAPVYDRLARLIIGSDIVTSQLHFLHHFNGCKHLLILGGGSGWLLDYLCKNCANIEIDYIDLSPKMLEAARRRDSNNNLVNFIEGTEEDIPNRLYDGVITNFYLDMFDENGLDKVIENIKTSLADHACWVVTDFVNERKGHAIQLWFMYRFFRVIAQIRATYLADWQSQTYKAGFELLQSRKFNNGFITTNLYKRASL